MSARRSENAKCQGRSAYCMDTPPHKPQRSRFFGGGNDGKSVLCCQDCTTIWFAGSAGEVKAVIAKHAARKDGNVEC